MTDNSRPRRAVRATALSALVLVLAGPVLPVFAQDTTMEARIRRMEAEVRALQRQVFPGDGKYFGPEIVPTAQATGQAAATPTTDLLTRMEALEAQLARLTAQSEESAAKIAQLEARTGGPISLASPTPTPSPTPTQSAANANLAAMTGGASAQASPSPSPSPSPAPSPTATASPAPRPTATASPSPRPTPTPSPAASGPSAQRLAAVRAIVKPQTADPGDDEYSYGFRLWEAKFYPEAQQQLKMMIERYPRHSRLSYARNLLGRAYLDEGKPRDAATWFLQNYQNGKTGERAPDSLLYLAESMRQLRDTSRACIALAEFSETYPREAAGRLRAQYEATRSGVRCS